MSEEEKILTEKNNISLDKKNNNHNLKISTQITESQQSIKTQTCKYKYIYTNTSNNKTIQENSKITNINITKNINNTDTTNNKNIKNNKKIYINSKNYLKKGIFSDYRLSKSPSPSKFRSTCETNYSINNISNIKYVNGNNKNLSKINYIRNPDIKFVNHEKSEKIINTKNNKNKIIGKGNEEKCQCDKNASCTCGKRINIQLYEGKGENNYMNLNNTNVNINRSYYEKSNNFGALKKMQKIENINVETYPVFFSDENINSESNLKLIKKRRMVKYSSPYNEKKMDNRSIKISRYSKEKNEIYNTIDDIRQKKVDNLNINTSIVKNVNRSKYLGNNSSNKKNHNFVNICHCSPNKNNTNAFSPGKHTRNSSKDSNKNYKYNISIKNINVNKGMNHSISYEKNRNKRNITNIYSSEEYKKYTEQRSNNSSYDKKDLKMQNAQNMQILQEEKLFHILVPIPPNQIEYSCNLQFSGSKKKKYTLEEINEMEKRKMIKKTEIIENENKEKNYNNLVNKEIIVKSNKKVKRPSWNKTNQPITGNNLSYEFEKKAPKKNEFDMENFEINIADNGRKFKGEMHIENNTIEIEKEEKDPNSNLLLSPNQAILLKADYPRRDWNNTSKLVSGRPFSIEGKPKQVLMERSVEKMSIKGKNQKKDWNISNNERKEVNINLYQKKKRQNLSKEKVQPFFIKGKNKNWNNITKKEIGSNIMIKGTEKEKLNEEEIIINNDYNIIEKSYMRPIRADIKKVHEISDESSSEYDVLKNLQIYGQTNDYRELIADSIKSNGEQKQKVIINHIKNNYPNGIETYKGKKTELNGVIWNNTKIVSNQDIISNSSKVNLAGTKIVYRERISKYLEENIDNENQSNSQNDLNNLKNSIIKDDNSKDNPTAFNSPKSQTKYSYREEIVSLSPNINDNNQIEYLSNTMSNKSFNQSGNVENLNEVLSDTNENIPTQQEEININYKNGYQAQPNLSLNLNNLQNQNNFDFMENTEQEIPKIQDEESPIENNYNKEIREQSPRSQQKIKYICKTGVNTHKNLSNDFFKDEIDNTNININHINSVGTGHFHTIPKNKEDINNNYNYNNNINYQIIQSEEINSINNKEIINQNYANENHANETDNINNSGIININYLNKINNMNNLNKANFNGKEIEVSKSQEIQSSASQSFYNHQNGNSQYENFVQNYSKFRMNNPNDNFNNFSINKLNIMPVSAGQYGNIIWNNSSSTSKQNNLKERENNESMKDNGINNSEFDTNNNYNFYNSYSFGAKSDKNSKQKVKVLKA